MKEKDIIARHITIEFDWNQFKKDVNEEDRETIYSFFDHIPSGGSSSGTIVWFQDGNPHNFYTNMTLKSFNKTVKFIEGNWLFRRYVQMKISFYNEYTHQIEEVTDGKRKRFRCKQIPLFKNIKKDE